MAAKTAKAEVALLRQETQFSCCAASIASALKAHGKDMTEAGVNKVLGASPMGGATWEAMLATVQYFGLRGTLVVPSTLTQLKAWTDAGTPVIIAWNPEGRPWSHASCVFHVDEEHNVHVMDPNIPDPSETVRIVPKSEFYKKWAEAVGNNLIVRRPAMAIEREVTPDGRQVMAGEAKSFNDLKREMGAEREAGTLTQPLMTRRDYGVTASMKASDYARILKYAVDLPPEVEEDVKEIQKKNPDYTEGQAWATAWSIHCKYRDPGSEHCQMSPGEYFKASSVTAEMLKDGKFEKGKSMTVDEVAEVVGPEFKEMNEDPPASVKKLKEEMGKKAGRSPLLAMDAFAEMLKDGKFEKGVPADPTENMSEEDAAEWERQTEEHKDEFKGASLDAVLHRDDDGTVPFDLFFNRTAAPKLVWKVNRVLGAQYAETPVGTYWIHPEGRNYEIRLDNTPVGFAGQDQYAEDPSADAKKMVEAHYAKALRGKTAAAKGAGGKWGFTKGTESACTAGVGKLQKAASRIAKALYAKDEGSPAFLQKHAAKAGSKTASMLLKAMENIGPMAALAKKGKTAGKSGNGLYGFSEKTAKLGLDACSALHHEAGVIAADLFARKGADPVKVAGYLATEAKKGKCAYSGLLSEVAPDVAEMMKTSAAAKKAADFMATEADDMLVDDEDDDLDLIEIIANPSR
jgi:predicted double-glycine peptidase